MEQLRTLSGEIAVVHRRMRESIADLERGASSAKGDVRSIVVNLQFHDLVTQLLQVLGAHLDEAVCEGGGREDTRFPGNLVLQNTLAIGEMEVFV